MADKIRVLLVEDNEEDRKLLTAIASEVEDTPTEISHASRLSDALGRLAREKFDAILLNLNLPDSNGLNTVTQARRAAPEVPILVLSALDDRATGIQVLQSGAQDYLIKGRFDGAQLIHAIRYALARSAGQAEKSGAARHKIIGFLGAKGGCGVTTAACHVAVELGRQTAGKVLLADFDLVAGAVAFLMKATSQHSVLDAVERLDGLDISSWRSIVTSRGPRLDILSAPSTLVGKVLPRPERLAGLLKFAQLNYPWIVVDLGRGLSDLSMHLLDKLDANCVLTMPDVLTLARTNQVAESLRQSSYAPERIHLAVNRMTRRSQLTVKDIEKVIKLPVASILPDDPQDLTAWHVKGTLLAGSSVLGAAFTRLAAKLAGIKAEQVRPRRFSLLARREAPAETAAGEQLQALLDWRPEGLDRDHQDALRQLNQKLTDARTELQQFAHLASHDLLEPARLIAGQVQLLAQRCQGRLDAGGDDLIASVLEGVARMQERMDGLADYAQVGASGAEFQSCSCEDELAEAISGLRKSIDDAAAVISHDPLPVIHADASQIRTVFHDLISNALTLRSTEPPRVHVRADHSGSEWAFAVQDNGIGLDPQHAGLAVTKKIVERHGGRSWVESEPGKGATFHFTIPERASVTVAQRSAVEGDP